MSGLSLNGGSTCTIQYGINGFNSGVTAPSTTGPYTFTAQEKSTAAGTLTSIASQPVVDVAPAVVDGTGTMNVSPFAESAGATGSTLTFTYNSAVVLSSGEITVALPAGWSAPSTSGTDPGYTTSTCGTVGVSGNTIHGDLDRQLCELLDHLRRHRLGWPRRDGHFDTGYLRVPRPGEIEQRRQPD
jgi:hypothetical protein